MKIASGVARYLAGVIFLVFGLNGFLHFIPLPPPNGVAGQFMAALYVSHYLPLIFGLQVVGAVLLLLNRFVPLALIVAALWALIFVDVRQAFAALVQPRLQARGAIDPA